MRHVLRYEGSFERNFTALRPGADGYLADDGTRQSALEWPADADGLRFGFMEKQGKRFVAVRVGNREQEVVLEHPVNLDPARHLGGRRFSAAPIAIGDQPASALLGDILDVNVGQRGELTELRDWVRRALAAPATPS
jgi:hypothetical protein